MPVWKVSYLHLPMQQLYYIPHIFTYYYIIVHNALVMCSWEEKKVINLPTYFFKSFMIQNDNRPFRYSQVHHIHTANQ